MKINFRDKFLIITSITLIFVVFAILDLIVEKTISTHLWTQRYNKMESLARLLAFSLEKAIDNGDDLMLVKTLANCPESGFHIGVVYDTFGEPYCAYPPSSLKEMTAISKGLMETFTRDAYHIDWSYDGENKEKRMFLAMYSKKKISGILMLAMSDPLRILSSTAVVKLRLLHLLAFILCITVLLGTTSVLKRKIESAPIPHLAHFDKIRGDSRVVQSPNASKGDIRAQTSSLAITRSLLKDAKGCFLILSDNQILAASNAAEQAFGDFEGKHVLDLESVFPDSVEKLSAPFGAGKMSISSSDGLEWIVSSVDEGDTRLLEFVLVVDGEFGGK